jgi:hypothetical protein
VIKSQPSIAPPLVRKINNGIEYEVLGERSYAADYGEAMVAILARLGRHNVGLLDRLAPAIKGRTRNHLARTPEEVYPERSDLLGQVKQVVPGWYLGCNISNREKEQFLRQACKLAGMSFGIDVKIDFGTGP